MAAVTFSSDFGAKENKVSHCFHCFPIYMPWSDVPDAMILVFWMLSFKPAFSLSSFTFVKRIYSSSSLSAIRVVSSAYLRLLIFLLAILIPAYASSSPALYMMYSAYKFGEFYQTCKEGLTPVKVKLNSSTKLERKECFLPHSVRLTLPWYQNQRYYMKRKPQTNISYRY